MYVTVMLFELIFHFINTQIERVNQNVAFFSECARKSLKNAKHFWKV